MEKTWNELLGVSAHGSAPFPFHFSYEEKVDIEADVTGMLRGMEAMREVQKNLGDLFPEKGIVKHDQYYQSRDALRQAMEQVIQKYSSTNSDRHEWLQCWPFDV